MGQAETRVRSTDAAAAGTSLQTENPAKHGWARGESTHPAQWEEEGESTHPAQREEEEERAALSTDKAGQHLWVPVLAPFYS